jgi:DNA-binding MarR family transcriptional regulator
MEHPERVEVAARLHSVAIHLLRRVKREDRRTGLSAARLSALSVLVFGGPRTLGELAAAEAVSAPTMTRLVAGLEAEGYVVREPSATDRRSVVVRATPEARAALEEGRLRRIRGVLEVLGGLSEAEWAEVGAAVALLESALAAEAGARPDDEG